jgi:hypothetical protein
MGPANAGYGEVRPLWRRFVVGSFRLQVRVASEADGRRLADVARASGLGEHDSGADPNYVEHLLRFGRVVIAEDHVSGPIGFAAAIVVGDRLMLTICSSARTVRVRAPAELC